MLVLLDGPICKKISIFQDQPLELVFQKENLKSYSVLQVAEPRVESQVTRRAVFSVEEEGASQACWVKISTEDAAG